MSAIEVKAKIASGDFAGQEGTINYDFGDTLEEAVQLHSEQVVYSKWVAQGKVDVQAAIRRAIVAGQSMEQLQSTYKLGVSAPRISDPIAAAKAKFATMSPEDKAEFLQGLKDMEE